MSAGRKAIRQAVAALLVGQTAAQGRVFQSRATPLFEVELPAICVYTTSEQVTVFDAAPKRYKRTVRLEVEIACKGDDTSDEVLDDLSAEVEQLFFKDDTLGGNAVDSRLAEVNAVLADDGEVMVAVAILSFDVDYYELAPPDQSDDLGPFEKIHTSWDQPPAGGEAPAEDLLELPQT